MGVWERPSNGIPEEPAPRKAKTRREGKWNHDADQTDPDAEGGRWFAERPEKRPVPLSCQQPGQPSKMVTLRALTVLSRVG